MSVEEIRFSGRDKDMRTLPDISPGTKRLFVNNCKNLKTIPQLTGIEYLNCNDTMLKELPIIPGLKYLSCSRCENLEKIPVIPGLKILDCSRSVKIKEIPVIPGLELLYCYGCTALETIAEIPGLQIVDLSGCKNVGVIPEIQGVTVFDYTELSNLGSTVEKALKLKPIYRNMFFRTSKETIECHCYFGDDFEGNFWRSLISIKEKSGTDMDYAKAVFEKYGSAIFSMEFRELIKKCDPMSKFYTHYRDKIHSSFWEKNPMCIATQSDDLELVEFLLNKANMSVEFPICDFRKLTVYDSPLHICITKLSSAKIGILKLLVEKKVPTDVCIEGKELCEYIDILPTSYRKEVYKILKPIYTNKLSDSEKIKEYELRHEKDKEIIRSLEGQVMALKSVIESFKNPMIIRI
jgi:hypothetical protein